MLTDISPRPINNVIVMCNTTTTENILAFLRQLNLHIEKTISLL